MATKTASTPTAPVATVASITQPTALRGRRAAMTTPSGVTIATAKRPESCAVLTEFDHLPVQSQQHQARNQAQKAERPRAYGESTGSPRAHPVAGPIPLGMNLLSSVFTRLPRLASHPLRDHRAGGRTLTPRSMAPCRCGRRLIQEGRPDQHGPTLATQRGSKMLLPPPFPGVLATARQAGRLHARVRQDRIRTLVAGYPTNRISRSREGGARTGMGGHRVFRFQ